MPGIRGSDMKKDLAQMKYFILIKRKGEYILVTTLDHSERQKLFGEDRDPGRFFLFIVLPVPCR